VPKRSWATQRGNLAKAATEKAARIRELVARLQERQAASASVIDCVSADTEVSKIEVAPGIDDSDFDILNQRPNEELIRVGQLFDSVIASDQPCHTALTWPHIGPRSILPWMIREVSRGRHSPPIRTLFLNMNRSALQALAGVEARTARLRARGVYRSGQDGTSPRSAEIGADAHFYMFLGETREGIQSVPLASIIPHSVALNDGTYWRDFEEKALKGFKRYFSLSRLHSIRKYLDSLVSAERSPAFAFLLPSHFDPSTRRAALARIPGSIDMVIIDMGTQALNGRNVSTLVCDMLAELEKYLPSRPKNVLILTDCPLRFSFIRRSLKSRRNPGPLGNRAESHRLVWASRGRGFDLVAPIESSLTPIVETIASRECVVATRLWAEARKLDETNPLGSTLLQGAAALKAMALTASGADAILRPYSDTHDFYHRVKRERHSFEPHYTKAMAFIGEGHGGPWRDKIQGDLAEALSLAASLRAETPLMRYLKRVLSDAGADEDILIVLRHPEDGQQTGELLLDYLTAPGSFPGRIPNLRVTTLSRYAAELETKRPTTVVWAASAIAGARAFIGDSFAPKQFRLVVAGQDALTLRRSLEVVLDVAEYAVYRERTSRLMRALPWVPDEVGGVATALGLDADKPRGALPFVGHGYLLLDGYGPVPASPGAQFYVLDPASQQLHPREARSIEVGDSVFVMSASIQEEIEALLREKDERGRTLEQALVDQYKAIVKSGVETLSRKEGGARITGARIHEILFEQNPSLPPIGKQAVDYWLRAADHVDVDTPYAAMNPLHLEAFLKLMGAGVMARQLADAVRVVRSALQRDGQQIEMRIDEAARAWFDKGISCRDSAIAGGTAMSRPLPEFCVDVSAMGAWRSAHHPVQRKSGFVGLRGTAGFARRSRRQDRHFRSPQRVTTDRGVKMPPGLRVAQTLSRRILSHRRRPVRIRGPSNGQRRLVRAAARFLEVELVKRC
jgi:hypothetical protein